MDGGNCVAVANADGPEALEHGLHALPRPHPVGVLSPRPRALVGWDRQRALFLRCFVRAGAKSNPVTLPGGELEGWCWDGGGGEKRGTSCRSDVQDHGCGLGSGGCVQK